MNKIYTKIIKCCKDCTYCFKSSTYSTCEHPKIWDKIESERLTPNAHNTIQPFCPLEDYDENLHN